MKSKVLRPNEVRLSIEVMKIKVIIFKYSNINNEIEILLFSSRLRRELSRTLADRSESLNNNQTLLIL